MLSKKRILYKWLTGFDAFDSLKEIKITELAVGADFIVSLSDNFTLFILVQTMMKFWDKEKVDTCEVAARVSGGILVMMRYDPDKDKIYLARREDLKLVVGFDGKYKYVSSGYVFSPSALNFLDSVGG